MNIVLSPLTGSGNVSKIDSFDTKKLVNDWLKSLSIDISDELAGNSRIDLYRCNETGLRFFVPSTVAGSEHLYEQLQKFEWFYMPWKWEHQVLYSRLQAAEKILEVGCATGSFIEKLHSEGFDAQGIEYNSAAVTAARERNLPVSSTDLHTLATTSPAAFDVVCSFQVLEHASDPRAFLENCIALLKPGGRLVICVPNNESFLRYQYNLLDMPPHHMTQWAIDTFYALEKLFPLHLTYVEYEPLAPYHVTGYLFAQKKRLRESSKFYRILLNRFSIAVISRVLNLGLRRYCRGQSIYVEFIRS
jgi:SAM-dependent methyltransferase